MVSLSIATSEPLTVSGVEVHGPVVIGGDSFTLFGQTITSGSWVVGHDVTHTLVQVGVFTPLQMELAFPLSLALCFILGLSRMGIR